jgi:hypothetical protein
MTNPGWKQRCLLLLVATSCTNEGGGVLETAELTMPIPSGYRSVSKADLVASGISKSTVEQTGATIERPGHSRISIMRVPPSAEDDGTPPTIEKCIHRATEFAEKNEEKVVAAGTLVEHPAEGLGRSCQFTVSWGRNQFTQMVAAEWGVVCIHPPGGGAVCEQVAAGFRPTR